MARSPIKLVPHITANQEYHRYHNLGRLAIYVTEVAGQEVLIANVYGYTGGHTDLEAAQGTDDIIAVIIDEIAKKVRKIPILIVGDLNADVDDLPLLHDLIVEHRWRDCGACASFWGGTDKQPTCFASHAKEATRRDFMIVSPLWFKGVAKFEVTNSDSFSVHQLIGMAVNLGNLKVKLNKF